MHRGDPGEIVSTPDSSTSFAMPASSSPPANDKSSSRTYGERPSVMLRGAGDVEVRCPERQLHVPQKGRNYASKHHLVQHQILRVLIEQRVESATLDVSLRCAGEEALGHMKLFTFGRNGPDSLTL